MNSDVAFLDGKLLVAMPGMGDPRFDRSVVFMCAHSSDGAMGLMINKPAIELTFAALLEQLEITLDDGTDAAATPDIFLGGPVDNGRGFVLHTDDYAVAGATLAVDGGFGMTATVEVLRDIARGKGPRESLLALGYAGWGPGQLEAELQRNGWLTCDADEAILFDIAPGDRWDRALARIGIDPRLLSSEGGRA